MSKIDLNEFKSLVPNVKDAIRKNLKVDAGNQSAYDIMAASRGYSSFHAVKASGNLPYYEVRANLGTSENPFYIKIELGHFVDRAVAYMEAGKALKGCQKFLTWFLYCNGENDHIQFETKPEPEKGFVYEIEVTGETLDDVEQGIEQVVSRLDNAQGFDRNETSSFSFRRAGEEYDFTEDTLEEMDFEEGPDGLIFDEKGVILSKLPEMDDTSELDDVLSDMGGRPEYATKTLIGGASVSTRSLMESFSNEFDTETYHVFGFKNGEPYVYFKGSVSDVVEELKCYPGGTLTFWVYEEMGMNEPASDDSSFLEAVSGKMLPTEKYALIDDNGIVFSSDDEQKIEETFNFAHDDLEDWEGTLYEAYQITPEQLLKARSEGDAENYIVVSVSDSGDPLNTYGGRSADFIIEVCLTKAFQGRRLMFFKKVRSV